MAVFDRVMRDAAEVAVKELPYFTTPALRQRLDLLRHLAEFSQQLLVVSAGTGGGKTALLAAMQQSLDENYRTVSLVATDDLSEVELLDQLAGALNLTLNTATDIYSLRQQLREHLRSLEKGMFVPLLLIDNAELLEDESLRGLLSLGQPDANGTRLRIVLFGRPELFDRLEGIRVELGQSEILHRLDIPPFTQEETTQFVEHLLSHQEQGVNVEALNKLARQAYEDAQGIPARIIAAVMTRDETVDIAFDEDIPQLGGETVGEDETRRSLPVFKLVGLAILLTGIVFAWLLYEPGGQSSSELIPLELPDSRKPVPVAARQPEPEQPAIEASPVTLPDDDVKSLSLVEGQQAREIVASAPAEIEATVETTVPENRTDQVSEAVPVSDTGVVDTTPAEAKPSETQPVIDVPAVQAETKQEEAKAADTDKDVKAVPAPVEQLAARPVATPYRDKDWLMQQKPEKYTLQMLGMYEKSAALEFLRQQKNQQEFSFFISRYRNKPWYVVSYGLYPDRDAAVRAISKLPRNLRRQKPWARPVGDIQKLIRETQQ